MATTDDPSELSTIPESLIWRGVASAVAPGDTLDGVQISLLEALAEALSGEPAGVGGAGDFQPVSAEELADALSGTPESYRYRVVHHMVLAELILRPIPPEVARRVQQYAYALGVNDRFVRVARRYAQGAFGLAWVDLHRSGFAEHWEEARMDQLRSRAKLPDQLSPGVVDRELAEAWDGFERLPEGSLGRSVWEMYRGRGFTLPGKAGGASAYLAQHDFIHVLADYGTNLNGEIEVFALIGRSDPDPKGFAWLTTLVGLFETGYVENAGFFSGDVRERHLDRREMHVRLADALRRGSVLCDLLGVDLLELDYHEMALRPVSDVREQLGFEPKSDNALMAGSPGLFDRDGMSRAQQRYADALLGT